MNYKNLIYFFIFAFTSFHKLNFVYQMDLFIIFCRASCFLDLALICLITDRLLCSSSSLINELSLARPAQLYTHAQTPTHTHAHAQALRHTLWYAG